MTSNKDLQKQANDRFRSLKWDTLLIQAFDEVKHYAAWMKNHNKHTQDEWNIGLVDISSDETLFPKEPDGIVHTLVAEFNGIKFKMAGANTVEGGYFSDDDIYNRQLIRLFIDNEEKINAIYHCAVRGEYTLWKDYRFVTLNAFHMDERIGVLLSGISSAIERKDLDRKQRRIADEEKRLEGKFSL
jgi:hypothetical protein